MKNTSCQHCGSLKEVRFYKQQRYLCGKHREQMRRYGEIKERTLATKNDYIDRGDYYEMVIYDRQYKEKGRAQIDKSDYPRLVGTSWCIDGGGYVMSGKDSLARYLMGRRKGMEIDHYDGNKLNNKRRNLNFVSHSANVKNWHRNRHLASGHDAESFFADLLTQSK